MHNHGIILIKQTKPSHLTHKLQNQAPSELNPHQIRPIASQITDTTNKSHQIQSGVSGKGRGYYQERSGTRSNCRNRSVNRLASTARNAMTEARVPRRREDGRGSATTPRRLAECPASPRQRAGESRVWWSRLRRTPSARCSLRGRALPSTTLLWPKQRRSPQKSPSPRCRRAATVTAEREKKKTKRRKR